MNRASPAYRYSARGRALRERHRPPSTPDVLAGGRFHGRCTKCDTIHRNPEFRYACPDCPGVFCLEGARARRFLCPNCGTTLEVLEEGVPT